MTDDLIARLDAAIGGPDRRRKDGARVRKMTPLKIEVQLLLDAKVEIEELRRQRAAYSNEITGALMPANDRLRKLLQEALNGEGWMDEHWRDAAREALGYE